MNNSMVKRRNTIAKKHPIVFSLDMHTVSIYIYAVDTRTGEVLHDTTVTGGCRSVLKRVKKCEERNKVQVIYEAGNMGFYPQRYFRDHGYPCHVIAPSSIPRSVKRQKTDREDAKGNFEYYINGQLSMVHIPDEEDECVRDLLRYRQSVVVSVTKVKQKVSAFLKRYGCSYTRTKSTWCKTYRKWLSEVTLPGVARYMLNNHIEDLEQQEQRLATVMQQLNSIFTSGRYAERYYLYRMIKGIGPVNAMTFVIELGDLNRFPHPTRLMSYIGVIPRKHASGSSDPNLHITKQGNRYVRLSCVGAAKHYRDYRTLYTKKQLQNLPDVLREFISRCQTRLCGRYYRLVSQQKKNSMVGRVAVARELCGFLWELMVKIRPQLAADTFMPAIAA